MPALQDFALGIYEDATIQVNLSPPTNISGFDLRFRLMSRFGGVSGLVVKTCASGYNNVSGINVNNGPQGQFQIRLNSIDTSGLDTRNYSYSVERTTSGSRTILTEGFVVILPTTGL